MNTTSRDTSQNTTLSHTRCTSYISSSGYDSDLCSGVDVGGNGCGFVVVAVGGGGGMRVIVVGIFTRVEA